MRGGESLLRESSDGIARDRRRLAAKERERERPLAHHRRGETFRRPIPLNTGSSGIVAMLVNGVVRTRSAGAPGGDRCAGGNSRARARVNPDSQKPRRGRGHAREKSLRRVVRERRDSWSLRAWRVRARG